MSGKDEFGGSDFDAALIAQIMEEDENRLAAEKIQNEMYGNQGGGGGNNNGMDMGNNPGNPQPYYQAPTVERLIDTPSSHARHGRGGAPRHNPAMDVEEEFGAIGGGYAGRNRSPPPVDNFPMPS